VDEITAKGLVSPAILFLRRTETAEIVARPAALRAV
jgi:hypothetical protein